MKKRTLFLIFTLLAVVFSGQNIIRAEKPAIIQGKWDRGLLEKIHLYQVENGELKELASSAIADDNTFIFACKPTEQGDFFYIGKDKLSIGRYAFFLKSGDVLDFTINDSTYVLNGDNNSPENIEMTRWHDFIQSMETKSVYFMNNISTYVDFFPLLEQKLKDLEHYPKNQTKNAAFEKTFEDYKKLNLLDITVGYLFKPRTTHPEGEDFPDYYRNLSVADFTKTTDLLNYPGGIALIDQVLMCKKVFIGGERSALAGDGLLSELNTIPNDTVKGEYILTFASRQKTYIGLTDFEGKYGKYLITDAQKIKFRNKKNSLTPAEENTPAIDFSFPDITGKQVTLSDLKGKVVYIDFWATWCGPCIKEIPSLKELETNYQGKDVVFLSISIDASKDRKKWEEFVVSKEMKGVQLFVGDKGHKEISAAYKITGIPRFVLVDKEGNIASPDAPRPSSSEIRPLINSLLK
jgi:thiol-disulfide isomerase/thioredoxin